MQLEHMTPVGFEPTQFALVELESTPLDHSGKVSAAGGTKIVVKASGTDFSFKLMKTEHHPAIDKVEAKSADTQI